MLLDCQRLLPDMTFGVSIRAFMLHYLDFAQEMRSFPLLTGFSGSGTPRVPVVMLMITAFVVCAQIILDTQLERMEVFDALVDDSVGDLQAFVRNVAVKLGRERLCL